MPYLLSGLLQLLSIGLQRYTSHESEQLNRGFFGTPPTSEGIDQLGNLNYFKYDVIYTIHRYCQSVVNQPVAKDIIDFTIVRVSEYPSITTQAPAIKLN